MPRPTPITAAERAELRRLFLAASQGAWKAHTVSQTSEHRLMADTGPGRELLLGFINHAEDAALAAAARNALPRLFAEIDELRAARRVLGRIRILGTVAPSVRIVVASLPGVGSAEAERSEAGAEPTPGARRTPRGREGVRR